MFRNDENHALTPQVHYHPVNSGQNEQIEAQAYHWHITIIPRITRINSDLLEGGVYVNPTLPENAAEFMRRSE